MNSPSTQKLFQRAKEGDVSILNHPLVVTSKDEFGETPLHLLARTGASEVLMHPKVAGARNKFEMTPLHLLAQVGCAEVLGHPEVDKVVDKYHATPLHLVAGAGCVEALTHPLVGAIPDSFGSTPLHHFAEWLCDRFYLSEMREGVTFDFKVVEQLLEIPKAATVQNNKGETPIQVLRNHGVISKNLNQFEFTE